MKPSLAAPASSDSGAAARATRLTSSESAEATPKAVLINLFRLAPMATSVQAIDQVGDLFGFSRSAVRVALTRLVRSGLAKRDGRGWYTIGPAEDPIHRWLERWRLGEKRTRPWNGAWLAGIADGTLSRTAQSRSHAALTRFGFRRGLPKVWVRPDNLPSTHEALVEGLRELELSERIEVITATGFSAPLRRRWCSELYALEDIAERYQRALKRLCASQRRLTKLPPTEAMVESMLEGALVVRLLTLDPLLPDEILSSAPRLELTDMLQSYDAEGTQIWLRELDDPKLLRPRRSKS